MNLYICNKAKTITCFGCHHSIPHEKEFKRYWNIDRKDSCTEWAECRDEEGNLISKVCCIQYKGD